MGLMNSLPETLTWGTRSRGTLWYLAIVVIFMELGGEISGGKNQKGGQFSWGWKANHIDHTF